MTKVSLLLHEGQDMSTTWAQHLSDVRSDLQDTSDTSPRWSTDMLYLYTKDGVRDYSTWFPKRLDHVEISLISGKYPLPLDYVEDIAIEYPADTLLQNTTLLRAGASISMLLSLEVCFLPTMRRMIFQQTSRTLRSSLPYLIQTWNSFVFTLRPKSIHR